jgi:hypothetical protein
MGQLKTLMILSVCLTGLMGCKFGNSDVRQVGGLILPSHFIFKEGAAPAGGKSACVIARMNVPETEQSWECVFEVSVPQRGASGAVTDDVAAKAAASAANKAAYDVLGAPPPHHAAEDCRKLQAKMQELLQPTVPGARVSGLDRLKKEDCTRF